MRAIVILFTGKTLSNGEHPLMLRISHKKKKKYRSLGISLPLTKWNEDTGKLKGMKAKSENDLKYKEYTDYLSLKKQIGEIESKYNEEISTLAKEGREVTIDQLIQMVEKPVKSITVLDYFQDRIDYLKNLGNIGNSEVYTTAKNRLSAFLNNKDIRFSDIDRPFLKKYREWLEMKNIRHTSMSIYLRTLRAIYNSAIADGYAKDANYPFGKGSVITGLDERTEKRAISKKDVDKIKKVKVKGRLNDAKNYFLFGYHGWGINFIDIALLKWTNINDGRVSYVRQKTKGKKQKRISFGITPSIQEILSFYKPLTGIDKTNYIFPILNKHIHISPTQIKNRIRKIIGQVNKDLKDLAKHEDVKIETNLTTYVSRHSFASVLKNELNASTEVISEMMGHSDVETTATYLAEFDNSVKDKIAEGL